MALFRKWLLSTSVAAMATLTAQAQYCLPDYGSGCANDDINDFYITGAGTTSISDLGTGCSANAYRNMSATMSVNMAQGSVYAATISTSGFFDQSAEVYIDFNNDHVFSPGESVGGSNNVEDIGTNVNINIPNGAPVGSHRMRVVLSPEYYYPGLSACPTVNAGYEYGEVHDYTANIITGVSNSCTAPASLAASGATANSASIIWQPVTGALGYEYVINQTSATPTAAGTFTTATAMAATSLAANTVYHIHVRTKCTATTFSGWTDLEFITTNTGNTCIAPTGLTTTAVTNNSADLTWAPAAGTQGYEIFASDVWGYPTSGTMWSATGVQYINLVPNTTYYMWLRHHCSGTDTSDWAVMTFTTTNNFQSSNDISGNIYIGDNNVQTADVYRVWLINHDTIANTLTAIDSLTTASSSYVFSNPPAGTYLVKAALLNGIGIPGLISQVPTYHDSSLYWNTAMQVTTDASHSYIADIWMREGLVTAGPGFVGGNVSLGANKGTGSGVAGLTIVLRNANGELLKGVYTDANGDFSFSNLPVGFYSVYPENLGYATTIAAINVTNGQPSIQNINFFQDDAQRNIMPHSTGIGNVAATNAVVSLTPNPAKNVLNISWSGYENEKELMLTITNSTGQTVLTQPLQAGKAAASINISALAQGVYFTHLSGAAGRIVSKLVIQR